MANPRDRANKGLRGLAAPPPPRTATPPPPPPPTLTPEPRTVAVDEPVGESGNNGTPAPSSGTSTRRPRRATTPKPQDRDGIPGRPVGNKRALVAHLPASVRDRLDDEVRQLEATKGLVIMRALREHYDDLAKRTISPSTKGSGPFPTERRVRRRTNVPHRVPTTYTVWPDECEALVQVADELDVNLSELVTDALALRYDIDPSAN